MAKSFPRLLSRYVCLDSKSLFTTLTDLLGLSFCRVGLWVRNGVRTYLQLTFAVQNNPTIDAVVSALTSTGSFTTSSATKGKVLCLHGFKTSSVVLQQQMAPLATILTARGYGLVVPDGPHATTGAAQGAEGIDDKDGDTFGWWRYASDDSSHDSVPIGVDASFATLEALSRHEGPFAGVIGFSQGGAMAAAVAKTLGVEWAILFSPVYVPQRPAQCDGLATNGLLVCADPEDEVAAATQKLVAELPAQNLQQLQHGYGHRLPPKDDSVFWREVERFVSKLGL